tara:strand:- start:162 stop:836 length:675 start_codon:yes stop_codon:yes gene_type:complete
MQIIGSGSPPPVGFQQPKNLYRFGETALWSTQLLAANDVIANGSYRLFTTPRGQNGQGFSATPLTIAETSIKEGGRVPSGAAYDVYGIACQLGFADGNTESTFKFDQPVNTDAEIAQLLNLHNNGTLAWDFLQTIVDIAPISVIGGGGGLYGSVATGNAVDSGHMNHGAGSIWLYRKHPVSLPGGSQFSVLLRFGSKAANIAAGNAAFVKVILYGFYKNVVEIG